MHASPAPAASWLVTVRRYERRIAGVWIGLTLLILAALAIGPVRGRVLARVQRAAAWWDARWDRRLETGEALVRAGRYVDAAQYLARLDAVFPARTARYGRDKEREHLLRLLAQSQEAAGHRGRAMATWARLAGFDSLNYRNHFAYAQAAHRLLGGWAMPAEARDGYARALHLLPSHVASLRGYVDYYMDRGEFLPVRSAYQAYLDSFLVGFLTVRLGDLTVTAPVVVDGEAHDLDLALPEAEGWDGAITIAADPYPLVVESVLATPAARVGELGVSTGAPSITATAEVRMIRAGAGWVPQDSTGALRFAVPKGSTDLGRIRLRVRLFKLTDGALWRQVSKAYRNLLDTEGMARAEQRTAPFASAAAADSAFLRQGWARGGEFIRSEP